MPQSASASASGSRPRQTSQEHISRHAGKGNADASFPPLSSSRGGRRSSPTAQPSDGFIATATPRSRHQRARSIPSASPFAPQPLPSSVAFPGAHTRTTSLVSHHQGSLKTPRSRVHSLSAFATVRGVPKADVLSPVAVKGDETIGSFTPTNCSRQHIQSLLGTSSRPRFFTFAARQLALGTRSPLRPDFNVPFDDDTVSPLDDDSPPASPIPSICRTPSSESELDYSPTSPSSAGPSTPLQTHSSTPSIHQSTSSSMGLRTPAALAAIEDKSKFRVRTSCSTCHKPGSNYPCCPRCGEMWCCRECRLQSTGGKKHVCAKQ